jgi:hypothetical protein
MLAQEDSTVKQTSSDSTRFYRPKRAPKRKTFSISMTEYSVKASMARLSYYAQGHYTNSLYRLEDIFIQANGFPEEVKNRMFGLALAGGLAREIFKQTRKELSKRNIRYVYPNLYGINIYYPIASLNARFYFRTMTLSDRYYMLYLKNGQYSLFYRKTPRYSQKGLYYRLYKKLRFFVTYTQYQHTVYNGLGLVHYSKKLFLYAMLSQNPDFPQYTRMYLYVNMQFD